MKKIYILLSAACVAASASAVEKQAIPSKNLIGEKAAAVQTVSASKDFKALHNMRMQNNFGATRAASVVGGYRVGPSVWSIGSSVNGYGYDVTFGFASSYGSLNFYGYASEGAEVEWEYSDINDYEVVDNAAVWNVKTSKDINLQIKSGIGNVNTPSIQIKGESGSTSYIAEPQFYYCGGCANMWIRSDETSGDFGVSPYQNYGLKTPGGYTAGKTYVSSYMPSANGYNAAGVYVNAEAWNNWQSQFEQMADGSKVTNLVMDNYSLMMPAPQSTYTMTRMWGPMQVDASGDTQLISYIYPLDEDGMMAEMPIALGYAPIKKGTNGWLLFEYNPLDENGDEIEDDIYIDSAVVITVEGFAGNDAIKSISPLSGYYPFSWNAYEQLGGVMLQSPTLYMQFSFDVDGQHVTTLEADYTAYAFDDKDIPTDDDTTSMLSYHQFNVDAVFAFIHSVDGVEKVSIAKDGGSVDVDIEAYWYDVKGLVEEGYYEVTAPEWLSVEFSEPDPQTLAVTMTVTAEAGDDRTGVISIEGLGATYSLTVNQGEGNAVNVIAVDKNAQYFDLQGRRVANPEKGIYIKKTGNKAEKVLF
ncbi:MAG: hypothetical protein K2K75_13550 [Muribaculaceae bacterium]|nr:hypothetical protein [Muribaculaceae bacterium]